MKKEVLEILKQRLGGAQDNLYRAKKQFENMTYDQFHGEYGQSGQTCANILLGYQTEVAKINKCIAWVKAV